ncbi:MAG: dihydroxy-acid dehydratase [Betaproteobacteria bacterium RIFCSPLOWO2_02_FULL_65_24]|nr:MAG: dihydroxy-acid dehydratase [Betaproteobacteria bacterium RIFCSPLOWO2_02_FULL_65_24]
MRRTLRSNFKPGTPNWAGRRAQWRSLGLTDEDMEKPKIAVVNSSSELASCFTHLDGVAARVKQAIRAAGGLPFEIRTAAPSDFITNAGRRGGYILPTRDLITNDIEVQVEGALLDGMLCLASCDKTTPGQLMAAGRLDIPTIVVVCGYQQSGRYRGEHIDIEEVFLKSSYVASGGVSLEEITEMADNAVRGPGVCAGMGTANSMHIVCEALGMSLPGGAPVLANSPKMMDYVRRAGERIVQMVWDDAKPRDIMTAESFANAAMVVLSLSASINTVKHLQAIAMESQCDVDVYELFSRYADKVPLLAAIRPTGEKLIEDLEAAGGARAVMKRLESLLHLNARTVSGQTLGEALRDVTIANEEVIHTLERPVSKPPSLVIVRGSLMPGGGIVRLGGERTLKLTGPANIFHSREEAMEAIGRGEVKAGQVVVLRGLGVKGGPGMAMTSSVVFALDGAGLIDKVGVVTEGQLSGLVNRGLVVGEASPEAMEGGLIGLADNGDPITIDVEKRVVNLDVPEAVLAQRREQPREYGSRSERGWLSIYQRTVQPVHKGAVLLKE